MAYAVRLHHPEAAGGSYELTEPNSATVVTGYSDFDVSVPIPVASQTLTATLGRATFYVFQVVEIVIRDAKGHEVDRWVEGARAELVELVGAAFSGMDVNAALTAAFVSVGGPDLKYLPVSGAAARLIKDVIGERFLSAADVVGPGGETLDGGGLVDNSIVLQTWIDALAAQGGGVGMLPAGTFALSDGIEITTPNITIIGRGRDNSTLFNTNPAGVVWDIDLGAIDAANCTMRDFTITHETVSSNRGIFCQNGGNVNLFDLTIDKHNRGVDMIGPDFDTRCFRCVVNETDGVAGSQAFILGADGRAVDCIASAVGGTGFVFRESHARAIRCIVPTTTTTGYEFFVANVLALQCRAENCGSGFTLNSGALRSGCIDCRTASNTVDFTTNANARDITSYGNDFTTFSIGEVGGHWGFDGRCEVLKKFEHDTNNRGPNIDADPQEAPVWVVVSPMDANDIFFQTNATNAVQNGQELQLITQNTSLIHNPAVTFAAQFVDPQTVPSLLQNETIISWFRWRSSDQRWVCIRSTLSTLDSGPNW